MDSRLISFFYLSIIAYLWFVVKLMWKCCELSIFYYLIYKKLRSQQLWKYCDNNKCYKIFTKYLFSIVVSYSFIFYYFISTYKKLTTNNCEICCVSITICMQVLINIYFLKKYKRKIEEKKNCSYRLQLGGKNGSLHQKEHRRGIASFYIVSRKKSTNW